MGSMKRSNFPAVLKQYLPDYEPSFVDLKTTKQTNTRRTSSCRCQNDAVGQKSKTRGGTTEEQPSEGKTDKELGPPVRESTIVLQRKQELKRYQQNYDNWQTAKAELKEDSIRQFRQRIQLQQELIRNREQLAAQRQQQLLEEQALKRKAEKLMKQSTAGALQQICKESLDTDRQRAVEELKIRREQKRSEQGSRESVLTQATFKAPTRPLPAPEPPAQVPLPAELPTHPSMVAEEDEEEDEEADVAAQEVATAQASTESSAQVIDNGEPLPWHVEQLYRLYGKQADYFVKPKLEEQERKKTVTVTGRKQIRMRGRAGAAPLWTSLRSDSEAKLLKQDMQISQELKAAYSAFVRQCLSHRKKPVKRNFHAEDDVPEMDRLLDQSRILGAHDYRHMVEVMFRASTMNKDRTGVLMHNNPLPNLNNWAGDESCGRYMPSWIPDYDEDDEEPVYRKWIKYKTRRPAASVDGSEPLVAQTARSECGQGDVAASADLVRQMGSVSVDGPPPRRDDNDGDQWDFLRSNKKRRKPRGPKYLFLTEDAARCAGEFSKRRKELLEARLIPAAFSDGGGGGERAQPKAQSALAMAGDNSTPRESAMSESQRSVAPQEGAGGQPAPCWPPLSLNALVEYKQALGVIGSGDFNQGTAPRWSIEKAH